MYLKGIFTKKTDNWNPDRTGIKWMKLFVQLALLVSLFIPCFTRAALYVDIKKTVLATSVSLYLNVRVGQS